MTVEQTPAYKPGMITGTEHCQLQHLAVMGIYSPLEAYPERGCYDVSNSRYSFHN